MIRSTHYFERLGKENTASCLDIVKEAVTGRGLRHIVVATTGGDTGLLFSETFKGIKDVNLVVVTHSFGYKEANTQEVPSDILEKMKGNGAKIYMGTMLTHSLETAFSNKHNGLYPTQIIAQSLRRFGEGTKVCCEIVMMAADAGLVPEGEYVLTAAGTGRGADTVLLIKAAVSKRFLDLRVSEVLAKPLF